MVFLLSGGGKFNYQGSRKWLEDGLDNTGGAFTEQTSALLSNTKLVVCLEGLASSDTNSLRMHVSKPPNPGTAAHTVHSNLIKVGSDYENLNIPDVCTASCDFHGRPAFDLWQAS